MNPAALREHLNASPFVPFEAHTTDGGVLPVGHPDFMFFDRGKQEVLSVSPDKTFHVVSVDAITRLTLRPHTKPAHSP